MSPTANPGDPLSPDDVLPPVEPPSAGFILQLFVIPGVIVVIIVLVWLMFNWLAQMGNDPRSYVRALERNNEARWQAAYNLANALRDDHAGRDSLRNDQRTAADLARILNNEITAGSMQEKPVTLRVYLARALGEFTTPQGLPVLVRAARTERDEREVDVRRAALEAIALLAQNLRNSGKTIEHAELFPTLKQAAADGNPLIRSAAAYAMGVVDGKDLKSDLHKLLEDTYPDVRYNAATALARSGDAESIHVLEEMLDPSEHSGTDVEKNAELRDDKQALILMNALEATRQLSLRNRSANLSRLERAAAKLTKADVPRPVRAKAAAVSKDLSGRSDQPKSVKAA